MVGKRRDAVNGVSLHKKSRDRLFSASLPRRLRQNILDQKWKVKIYTLAKPGRLVEVLHMYGTETITEPTR